MLIRGTAHLHGDEGDPCVHCERIEILAQTYSEASNKLALLFRMLDDPETRARLLETAIAVEAEMMAAESLRA